MDAKRYKHYAPLQHFKLRPARDIGDVEAKAVERWVLEGALLKRAQLTLSAGLDKLLDEVFQNACDNATTRRVYVRVGERAVTVCNDGDTITLAKAEDHPDVWIPEMVFSMFGSGSNLDDAAHARTGAGMNGIGVKAVAAMSTKLKLVCWNGKTRYTQWFMDRLEDVRPPVLEPCKEKQWSTTVMFTPELAAFPGVADLQDFARAAQARVLKASAYLGRTIAFTWNDEPVAVRDIKAYAALFGGEACVVKTAAFELAVGPSPLADEGVLESCTAGIDTSEGGTHADCALKLVVNTIIERVLKKTKLKASEALVRSCLLLVCFYRTTNPMFSGQTKARLTSPIPAAARAELKAAVDAQANKFVGIENRVVAKLKAQKDGEAVRALGGAGRRREVSVRGLRDAQRAGKAGCANVMMFAVEGESAMSMAAGGIASVLGRDLYGALAMRGKPKNVAGMDLAKALKCESVACVAQALGLKAPPFDPAQLRYGRGVCIMTDQDDDGSHICALMLQMMRQFWPEMLHQGKVWRFVTPLVKVYRSAADRAKGKHLKMFFDEDEFEEWRRTGWKNGMCARYYKGLGSHDPQEVQAYFRDLPTHLKRITYDEAGEAALNMAFSATAEHRRDWLEQPPAERERIDYSAESIAVSDFMNVEYRRFGGARNRSILVRLEDGLKDVQRKIVFVALAECAQSKKVPEVAGLLASRAQYHHGEESAKDAVVKMARCWPGSNNLPLLKAEGNVGSRRGGTAEGGKQAPGADAAAPRYLAVALSPLARLVMHPQDVLKPRVVDGQEAEPETYFPTLPLALVNGVRGSIGIGFSASVPCFSVVELIDALERKCSNKTPCWPTTPHVDGFRGTFVPMDSKPGWVCRGVFARSGARVEVSEIPLTTSLTGYAEVLARLEAQGAIQDVVDDSRNNVPRFSFCVANPDWEPTHQSLELEANVPFLLNCIDAQDRVRNFASVAEYMDAWWEAKLSAMHARKKAVEADMQRRKRHMEAELAFLDLVKRDVLRPRAMTETQMRETMEAHDLKEWADEFMGRSLRALGTDTLAKKQQAHKAYCAECVEYAATTAERLYLRDLEALRAAWGEERKKMDARNQA